ncbi:MAG: Ada metal-binding domain-containing protein [Bacteroidota bacterium]
MIAHASLSPKELRESIRRGSITLAGNATLKIYGRLRCRSGKRMKTENRVFFRNEVQAKKAGYRPCGHCMRAEYVVWKNTRG